MSTRTALKAFFETGDIPTEAQFADLIDSLLHLTEDTTDDLTEGATNKYLSASDKSKLDGIAAGAEVNPAVVSQAEAEAGLVTSERIWTPQRVKQAIQALGAKLPTTQAVQTASFTATAGRLYPCDSASGATLCNPPASPNVGDQFGVSDARRSFDTANFKVRFFTAGQRFCGDASSAADITLTKQDQCLIFEYTGATYGWVLISGSLN